MSEVSMTRMTGGEVWVAREYLGLSRAEFARILNVRPGTVADWEVGKLRTPHRLTQQIERLKDAADVAVADLVTGLRAMGDPQVTIYWAADDVPPGRSQVTKYGFGWWRHVVARALEQVPGTRIGSQEEISDIRASDGDFEANGASEKWHKKER